jgi:multiple sugar transport system substrate-binding protein/arabinosaccharide transport system substrate-binding protein
VSPSSLANQALSRNWTRRGFVTAATSLAASVILAACGQPAPTTEPKPNPTTAPAAAPPTTAPAATAKPAAAASTPAAAPAAKSTGNELTFLMWTWDAQHVKFVKDRIDTWTSANSKYKATLDSQQMPGGDLYTKVLANYSAGAGAPDILPIELNSFSRFMKGDIAEKTLVDITDLIRPERNKFIESRWINFTWKGKTYGIDNGYNPGGYWHQPEILQAAGVELPIKTWDDFTNAGKLLKDKSKGKSYLAPIDDLDRAVFQQLLQQRGGQIFNQDGNVVLNSPEAVEVLQYLVNAANNDKIFLKAGSDSFWGAATYAAYRDGTSAGVILPDWYLDATLKPELADMKGKWRVQAPPVWKGGGFKGYGYGGAGWTMSKQTKLPTDALWDFMHFAFMTKESQVKKFQLIHYFPFMKEAIHDPGVTDVADDYCGGQKIGGVFASFMEDGATFWNSQFWQEAVKALNDQLTQAYAGKITPAQAIQTADANIKAIVAKGQ